MLKVKASKWVHGNKLYYDHLIYVQKTPDGWFAKIEPNRECGQLLILSGPWGTQALAEDGIMAALEQAIVARSHEDQ